MPPLLIFDLDGTLADTMLDLVPVLNRVIAPHGVAAIANEDVGHIVGHGARAMIERAFAFSGMHLDASLADALLASFIDDYSRNIAVHTRLFPGAVAAMDELSASGHRFSVCTNKMESLARKLLDALAIENRFASITGGDTFPFRKPDARHIRQTIAAARLPETHAAIMIGDSETDIRAAKAAAIPVIAVDFGYSEEPVASYGPDRVISGFDELPKAVASLSQA